MSRPTRREDTSTKPTTLHAFNRIKEKNILRIPIDVRIAKHQRPNVGNEKVFGLVVFHVTKSEFGKFLGKRKQVIRHFCKQMFRHYLPSTFRCPTGVSFV